MSSISYFGEQRYNSLIEKGSCPKEAQRVKAIAQIYEILRTFHTDKNAQKEIYKIASRNKEDSTVLYKAFLVLLENQKMEEANQVAELFLGEMEKSPDATVAGRFGAEYSMSGFYEKAIWFYQTLLGYDFGENEKREINQWLSGLQEK